MGNKNDLIDRIELLKALSVWYAIGDKASIDEACLDLPSARPTKCS